MVHEIVRRGMGRAGNGPRCLAALLAAMSMLFNSNGSFPEGRIVMAKAAAADGPQNPARSSTTPPARDPEVAVQEEYQAAQQQGTAAALELFIARHPDSPLAEKARAELRRLPR